MWSIQPVRTISLTALRRLVIDAQQYVTRPRRGTATSVEEMVRGLSCVQLDSISVVERSHRIALGTRVGTYPRDTVSRLLSQGRVFEYWAHEACLLPVEDWPLFQAPMEDGGRKWWGSVEQTHPHLREEISAGPWARVTSKARPIRGCGSASQPRRCST
jgi:uncharacterized protein